MRSGLSLRAKTSTTLPVPHALLAALLRAHAPGSHVLVQVDTRAPGRPGVRRITHPDGTPLRHPALHEKLARYLDHLPAPAETLALPVPETLDAPPVPVVLTLPGKERTLDASHLFARLKDEHLLDFIRARPHRDDRTARLAERLDPAATQAAYAMRDVLAHALHTHPHLAADLEAAWTGGRA